MTEIRLTNLSKSYDGEPVLKKISFSLSHGRIYCLMAPSGAGKTTLFRILMGLETADSGQITGLSDLKISAVFQEDRLIPGYTALQNIKLVTGKQYTDSELKEALLRLLPEDSLQKPVWEYSGGMKRRTAILRALLAPSDFIIMDEPFTGLDYQTRLHVIDMIKEYTKEKLLLISTHSEDDVSLLGAELITL